MIDETKITEAILATGCSPLALEEGAGLVDAWLNNYANDADEILAVEAGFSIRLDDLTWAIGVMDLIARDDRGIFGDEHKSTKEPSRYWTEEKWLESIKTGPQIGLYALALWRGEFYENGSKISFRKTSDPNCGFCLGKGTVDSGGVALGEGIDVACSCTYESRLPIRIRVRAAVKTAVPMFWPRDPADGWQEFNEEALAAIARAFRSKAAQIRAARRAGLIPWQLPGRQCHEFNRACEHFEDCRVYRGPELLAGFDGDDPAARLALPFLAPEAQSPDAVILSASAYQDYSKCMDLGRRNAVASGKEQNLALEVGTVLHAGLAAYYEQFRSSQKDNQK